MSDNRIFSPAQGFNHLGGISFDNWALPVNSDFFTLPAHICEQIALEATIITAAEMDAEIENNNELSDHDKQEQRDLLLRLVEHTLPSKPVKDEDNKEQVGSTPSDPGIVKYTPGTFFRQ